MEGTWEDRQSAGRAARKTVPRTVHAEWSPAAGRDPVAVLEAQGASRVADLLPIRYGRMAQSPFAFFRGAAAVMAYDLSTTPTTGFRVQACGDAHVTNFGNFATPERNLVFDINDFDETLPGPWEWDVKRLAASLHVVARQRHFSGPQCDEVVTAAVRAYRERMLECATMRLLERWYARTEAKDVIAHFPAKYRPLVKRDVEKSRRKDHRRAVAKLTKNVGDDVHFVEDPPLLVHLDDTGHDIGEVMAMVESYQATLPRDRQDLFGRLRLVDVARKVVGVGSVGTRCWICLFEGPDRPKGDHVILQVKEAQPSVLEPYVGASTLEHQGMRVVVGQRLTQAASDIFLGWAEAVGSGRHYYVRQLWDSKGQGDPMAMDLNNLSHYGALCALALAQAHARTGDPVAISGYLGKADTFDRGIAAFATAYAIVNEQDHAALLGAIEDGRLDAQLGI
ncbi:MAG: DUF2252 domain-containing protein [Acidimicrobiia bacterium]